MLILLSRRYAISTLFSGYFLFAGLISGKTQAIPAGSALYETVRSMQLMSKFDSSVSFTVRPLAGDTKHNYSALAYSFLNSSDKSASTTQLRNFSSGPARFVLLPFSLTQQFNTHHPYGWNDGPMINAKGYQALASIGVYASAGPLEVQLQPEGIFAANPAYESNADYGSNGGGTYLKFFPGQSTVRVSVGNFSAGISSASLWWGPGRKSSLLMSDNAPGFIHAFFGSRKPWSTAIGSFEWQLIGAKLSAENGRPYENFHLKANTIPGGARYLNAYVLTYQPKWVPGLFLGMTRGLQRYQDDITVSTGSVLARYLPLITKIFQRTAPGIDSLRNDQLASVFLRWVLPKAQAEFYIEYGYNDYFQNVRDILLGPGHAAAYIAGAKKIITLQGGKYLDLGMEITQMTQTPDLLVRDAGNWYVHSGVLQGYTHQNQIIGAGAGLGSNVQTVTATWVNGWKQLGLLLERVERDPQYHANKWTDLSIGVAPQWKFGNMVVSGLLQGISSRNYAWAKSSNRFNLHSRVGIQYFF